MKGVKRVMNDLDLQEHMSVDRNEWNNDNNNDKL